VIIVVGFLVAVLTVPMFGGNLWDVAEIKIRDGHLIVVSFVIQTLVISFVASRVPEAVSQTVHLYSYLLALMFVFLNRRLTGLTVVALGAAANTVAIAANGGVMPASDLAERIAGIDPGAGFANSSVVADAKFLPLGDVFAVPHGWPFANVFSIGDVLLVIGAGIVLHHACGSRLARSSPRHPQLTAR